MRSKRQLRNQSIRDDIATTAARMLAEGTAQSFQEAKHKAVASLGIQSSRKLPENLQVQTALKDYLRLFEGAEFAERLTHMRREALVAMQRLSDYEPRLVGPVLYGSACYYSPVTLHLHCDEPESVMRFFHNQKINYSTESTTLNVGASRTETFPLFAVVNNELEFEIAVLPLAYLSHPPISALDARPFRRADFARVEQLIDYDPELLGLAIIDAPQ